MSADLAAAESRRRDNSLRRSAPLSAFFVRVKSRQANGHQKSSKGYTLRS
jgi:hypothetical protein